MQLAVVNAHGDGVGKIWFHVSCNHGNYISTDGHEDYYTVSEYALIADKNRSDVQLIIAVT